MKSRCLILPILLILLSMAPTKQPVQVYLVGDSLMADKAASRYPLTGWGQVLHEYFSPDVTVHNLAHYGRTTRTFVAENHWKLLLDSLKKGDYVLIGFGHNDEKVDIPNIGVQLADFRNYLLGFIKDVRQQSAIPVLLTPVSRRSFINGVYQDTHKAYADVTREIAQQQNVPLIDLEQKTEQIVRKMGEDGSKKFFNWVDRAAYPAYPKGSKDNTHLSAYGAHQVAALVAEGVRAQHLALAKYLVVANNNF